MARKASLNSLLAKLEEDLDGPKSAPRGDVYRYEEVSEDVSGLANTTVSIRGESRLALPKEDVREWYRHSCGSSMSVTHGFFLPLHCQLRSQLRTGFQY